MNVFQVDGEVKKQIKISILIRQKKEKEEIF